ncbi:MAG TPA: IS1 family transposase [Candidatus Tectomicrobia bacterium]
MLIRILHCPTCQSAEIVRHGQTRQSKQRYRCREQRCASRAFLLPFGEQLLEDIPLLALIMASATPADDVPGRSTYTPEELEVWGPHPACRVAESGRRGDRSPIVDQKQMLRGLR